MSESMKKINADLNKNYELFGKNYDSSFNSFLQRDLETTARKTGGWVSGGNRLVLNFFEKKVILDPFLKKIFILPDYSEELTGNEEMLDQFISSIILHYVLNADGSPLQNEWVQYRELPDGMFYASTIPGVLEPAIKKYATDGPGFLQRMGKMGSIKQNDFKFAAVLLPFKKFPMLFILDEKDEEFDAGLRVLFDRSASHFLKTDIIKTLLVYTIKRLTG
ncbi:MAG: DUF3786 domain-containing protein [Actinobacteria bacterium]|nr:DUF3786 domain-containing protein [Actinomycetota bacterium]